jgi:lauroyl/myristoyl acyltransferase
MRDGMSDVNAAQLAERQEAGAAERAHLLIEGLATGGALTWNRPDRRKTRWRVRRLAAVTAGLGLGFASALVRHMPAPVVARAIGLIPSSLFATHVYRSGAAMTMAHLRSSIFADRPPAWLRRVGVGSAAVSVTNASFMFLTTVLARSRMNLVSDRVVDRSSADLLAAQVAEAGPMIGVFLHGGLFGVVPNVLRTRGHRVVRAVMPLTHGTYLSEASGKLTDLWGETPELTVDASDALGTAAMVRRLEEGSSVYIALDKLAIDRPPGTVYILGLALPRNDGPAWLAVRSGRPLALWTTHLERGRFVISTTPTLQPDSALPPRERVARLSEQLYRLAEEAIRAHPEAWACWTYLDGRTGGSEIARAEPDQPRSGTRDPDQSGMPIGIAHSRTDAARHRDGW